jgi:hypothetical protein
MMCRIGRAWQESVLTIRSSSVDKTRTNFSVLVVLRRGTRIPLHRQIETSIRDAIRAGRDSGRPGRHPGGPAGRIRCRCRRADAVAPVADRFVMPGHLAEPMAEAKIAADRGSPALEQLALADLMAKGEFDRHLRRMLPVYRRRRDALLTALSRRLPWLEPAGVSAGLHLVTWLPPAWTRRPWSTRRPGPGWASRA